MAIDIKYEKLLTLGEACRLLPRPPSPSTLWRWRTVGVHGVRLECIRAGGRWCTTAGAVAEFLVRQTAACTAQQAAANDKSDSRSDSTLCRLRDAGLMDDNSDG